MRPIECTISSYLIVMSRYCRHMSVRIDGDNYAGMPRRIAIVMGPCCNIPRLRFFVRSKHSPARYSYSRSGPLSSQWRAWLSIASNHNGRCTSFFCHIINELITLVRSRRKIVLPLPIRPCGAPTILLRGLRNPLPSCFRSFASGRAFLYKDMPPIDRHPAPVRIALCGRRRLPRLHRSSGNLCPAGARRIRFQPSFLIFLVRSGSKFRKSPLQSVITRK